MKMIRKAIMLITVAGFIILLIAALTNPTKEEHKNAVSKKVNAYMRQEANKNREEESLFEKAGEEAGLALGSALIDKILDYAVDRDNYIIVSFTTLTWEGEDRIIGIGLFGKVIILEDLENIINNRKIAAY